MYLPCNINKSIDQCHLLLRKFISTGEVLLYYSIKRQTKRNEQFLNIILFKTYVMHLFFYRIIYTDNYNTIHNTLMQTKKVFKNHVLYQCYIYMYLTIRKSVKVSGDNNKSCIVSLQTLVIFSLKVLSSGN